MAYYTALINAWNNPTQLPAGVAGTLLNGLVTADKITAVNGWTMTGSIPTLAFSTGNQIFNCLVWSEYTAITAAQQTQLMQLCTIPGNLQGGSASTFIAPFFGTIAAKMPLTIAALTALSKALTQPWWQVPQANGGAGLSSPVSQADITAAGLS